MYRTRYELNNAHVFTSGNYSVVVLVEESMSAFPSPVTVEVVPIESATAVAVPVPSPFELEDAALVPRSGQSMGLSHRRRHWRIPIS